MESQVTLQANRKIPHRFDILRRHNHDRIAFDFLGDLGLNRLRVALLPAFSQQYLLEVRLSAVDTRACRRRMISDLPFVSQSIPNTFMLVSLC